ncbi:MAG: lipopolysaccharide biosynthesis protein [Bacteroidetes bacterium]|nr:lipopolysaccharide biosynthesis protein [Bacteroidota bacterium]
MFKKIFTNTLIYALGPQLPKIASFFVLPIITKDLTSVDYGVYGVVIAYTGLLGGLKDLGVSVNMSNLFYRHPTRWQTGWRQLHAYVSLWSIPYALLQSLLLYFIIPHEAQSDKWLIIILISSSSVFFDATIMFGSRYYQLAQRPFYMALTSAIVGSLSIALNLISISYFKMGYMGWFVSTFIGTFISFLFYFFPLYFKYKLIPIFKIRLKFVSRQLKIALPMVPHNYSAYLLSTSDRLVMNVLGIKISEIGIYNIAYTFGNYVDFGGSAIGMAVGPMYTKLYSSKQERDVRSLTFTLQTCFLFGSFLLCLWIKELFWLLIKNPELQSGYYLAIIVVMGYNYRPMYWAVVNKLAYHEQTQVMWRISFTAGVVNIILNFILIPIYGFQVAAITSFIGLMYIGFSGFFLKAYREMDNLDYFPVIWIGAIIGLSVLVYFLRDTPVQIKLMISAVVTFLGVVGFYKFKDLLSTTRI